MNRFKNQWNNILNIDNIHKHWDLHNKTLHVSKRRPWTLEAGLNIQTHLKYHDAVIDSLKHRVIGNKARHEKERLLVIPSFNSIVAQNAILEFLGPFLNKKIHHRSFSSRPGMGMHKSAKLQNHLVQTNKKVKYALVFDIKKFYDSLDVEDLLDYLHRTAIKDRDVFETIVNLLHAHDGGLAVGFCVSHYFANYYLCPLWKVIMKAKKTVIDCFVYMDNFVVYTATKSAARAARDAAQKWLAERGLRMKSDHQYFPVDSRPIKTCGVQIQRGKPMKLYDVAFYKILRNIEKIQAHFTEALFKSLAARLGSLKLIKRMDLLTRFCPWESLVEQYRAIQYRRKHCA